jgi:DNA-binding NtrC family response regulator
MPSREATILVVERPETAAELASHLRGRGWKTLTADRDDAAQRALDEARVDAVVVPLAARGIDGLALCAYARRRHASVCVIVAVEGTQASRAHAVIAAGATAVVLHPIDPEWLAAAIERGIAQLRLAEHAAILERQLDERLRIAPFDGQSRAIERVTDQVRHLATTHTPVLIEGEAGTGKRLAARAIHHNSPRRDEPFVEYDCAAAVAPRLESELFGEEAVAARGEIRPGRIEEADGGTLLLADVDALSAGAQVRALHLLQDHAIERLGGGTTLKVDTRLLASTTQDLAERAAAGSFREDLLQRIGAVRIRIPPLRERREDIPFLVERFLTEASRTHDRRIRGVTRGVLDRLMQRHWPGNVRELRDTVERMVTVARRGSRLGTEDLWPANGPPGAEPERFEIQVGTTVGDAERALIIATLAHTRYDKPKAAALLGIGLRTLYRKIKEYGIHPPSPGS